MARAVRASSAPRVVPDRGGEATGRETAWTPLPRGASLRGMTMDGMRRIPRLAALAPVALVLSLAGEARAQVPRVDFPVTDGYVTALSSLEGTLYVGGYFSHVGTPSSRAWMPRPARGCRARRA
jgi:hypothetical protein